MDGDRPKFSALYKRYATPSPKPTRAGRFLKPRRSDFSEESVYKSSPSRGLAWPTKGNLQHKLEDLKAENKLLKIDMMHAQSRLLQQSKRSSLEIASASSMLREFKLLMQTRELDYQREELTQRTSLMNYQRALQDVTQTLVTALAQMPERPDLARSCLDELEAVNTRLQGKDIDGAIEQLKRSPMLAREEVPLSYYSPSNSGKEMMSTARFKDFDVSVD
jgi:hypothetical protein